MKSLLQETQHTLKLAFPMIASNLGQMLLGLTDTIMIGRVGTVELAAVSLMNILFHVVIVLAVSLAVAVQVQVSHAHGSEQADEMANVLKHGLCMSLLIGALVWVGMIFSLPGLQWLKQPAEVLDIMPAYLLWIAPSMMLMMPIMVIKSFAEAQNLPWGVFLLQLLGVFLNIGLNALLIFGLAGFPQMGLAGAGLATFLARLFTLLIMALYLRKKFPTLNLQQIRLQALAFITLFKLALPIGAQMLMEFGAFAMSALLIGRLGALPMAAHQIALTCATTTYMIPMGLSNAVGIRVGQAIGAGAVDRCRHIIQGAQSLTLLLMSIFAGMYLTFGTQIASLFTPDPGLIVMAASLLSIAGIFQLFDGIQVLSVGALRAMKDVKIPTLLSFIGYWLIAFPFGVWLGLGQGYGVIGFWIGLATGLSIAALTMSLRLVWLLRRR